MKRDSLRRRIRKALGDLNLDPDLPEKRNLPQYEDAIDLVIAERGQDGRAHELTPTAAACWRELRQAASADGISIYIVSAFRGFDRQVELIRAAIDSGRSATDIFANMSPPGCSEHHTGEAVDIGTPECPDLTESFADTSAFRWLTTNGSRFRFALSFPKGNAFGYVYEPWHWRFR